MAAPPLLLVGCAADDVGADISCTGVTSMACTGVLNLVIFIGGSEDSSESLGMEEARLSGASAFGFSGGGDLGLLLDLLGDPCGADFTLCVNEGLRPSYEISKLDKHSHKLMRSCKLDL